MGDDRDRAVPARVAGDATRADADADDARVGARERMWEISRDRIARGGGGYGGWMATRAGERERERDAGPIRRDATTETTETTDDSPAVCFDDAEKSFSRSRVC